MASDRALAGQLERLARSARIVLVAGLPGTGKSLLIHQLAHLAADAGRVIHLLQWDVARPVFEASPAGRRYPMADGVTHAVVRKAVGLWARRALLEWQRRCAAPRHALIGEAPLVGNRLIELARRMDDATEPVLAAASCRFVIAVPSAAVRGFLEAERERRAARPLHPREREDAPPAVLKALWRELVGVAQALGIPVDAGAGEPHNPKVKGSNPFPATGDPGRRPGSLCIRSYCTGVRTSVPSNRALQRSRAASCLWARLDAAQSRQGSGGDASLAAAAP